MLAELKDRIGAELDRLTAELPALALDAGRGAEDRGVAVADDGLLGARQRRIRLLGQLIAGLSCVDASMISHDRAGYGSVVRLRDLQTSGEDTYMLMAGEFIDLDEGQVSVASPMGNALLGTRAGDVVPVATPRGNRRYEVLSVVTLPERLGITGSEPPGGPAGSAGLQVA